MLLLVIALALTAGVVCTAVDLARRATTLGTFLQGMGAPDNPSDNAVREAEWNLAYLLGLSVGLVSALGASVAVWLWWRLAQSRHQNAEPLAAPDPAT
jgi:hypothetical protein